MWLWACELHDLGFRRRSESYWRCENRFHLPVNGHLSIFSWGEQSVPGHRGRNRFLVELTEFHVTFLLGFEHVHFYYHEILDNDWEPGGHTSPAEIGRLGYDVIALRDSADEIAAEVIAALRGVLRSRNG
jgi:hypothetical protein